MGTGWGQWLEKVFEHCTNAHHFRFFLFFFFYFSTPHFTLTHIRIIRKPSIFFQHSTPAPSIPLSFLCIHSSIHITCLLTNASPSVLDLVTLPPLLLRQTHPSHTQTLCQPTTNNKTPLSVYAFFFPFSFVVPGQKQHHPSPLKKSKGQRKEKKVTHPPCQRLTNIYPLDFFFFFPSSLPPLYFLFSVSIPSRAKMAPSSLCLIPPFLMSCQNCFLRGCEYVSRTRRHSFLFFLREGHALLFFFSFSVLCYVRFHACMLSFVSI